MTCQGWRSPRTTTTISWADGELGPAYISFGEGQLGDQDVKELNKEYAGTLHIMQTNKKSHMWNGEVCVQFFEMMTQEIRRKRLALGFQNAADAPCLALCDRAPSHQSSVFQQMRMNWARENNVILVGADLAGECNVPAGFGAVMQPNDQWLWHTKVVFSIFLLFTISIQKIEKLTKLLKIHKNTHNTKQANKLAYAPLIPKSVYIYIIHANAQSSSHMVCKNTNARA